MKMKNNSLEDQNKLTTTRPKSSNAFTYIEANVTQARKHATKKEPVSKNQIFEQNKTLSALINKIK